METCFKETHTLNQMEQITRKITKMRFVTILEQFCDETTMHGLYHMKHTLFPWKAAWIKIVLLMFLLTAYYCSKSGLQYSAHDVKTTMVYEIRKDLQFPAITFCNQFSLTTAGGSIANILLGYETLFAKKFSDMGKLILESQKTCKQNILPLLQNTTFDMSSGDSTKYMKYFTQDSFRDIVTCWWKNKEIDCTGWFANQILDAGLCFTFHPDKEIANNLHSSGLSGLLYGLNDTCIETKRIVNTGSKNGLQFLLNTTQNEYCDVSRKYEGAGFRVMIHDSDNLRPFLSLYPSFSLKPGSVVQVLLKPTVFERRTAHLGKCNTSVYSFNKKKFYFVNMCIQQCLVRRVTSVCNCNTMFMNDGWKDYIFSTMGINVSSYRTCDVTDMQCIMARQYETYESDDPKNVCPECLQPCLETKYDVSVTYANFPSNTFLSTFIGKSNPSSIIHKNFILANFFFESLTVLKVYETESFTIVDMLIYIGGVIGLFLGMSFLTVFEFGQIFFMSFFYEVHKIENYGNFTEYFVKKDIKSQLFKKTTKLQSIRRNAVYPSHRQSLTKFKVSNTRDL